MADRLKLCLAQINLLVGDIDGNVAKILDHTTRARDTHGADLTVFPELTLTSYPPEDLLLRREFLDRADAGFARLCDGVRGTAILVGHPLRRDGRLYNAASVIADGAVRATYLKHTLPNYAVFDEMRYFTPGTAPCVVTLKGVPLGITICEDMWSDAPIAQSVAAGARAILSINGSPYHTGKDRERRTLAARHTRTHGVPFVYVNLVGGQDELVFDGQSFAIDAEGELALRAPAFVEGLYPLEIEAGATPRLPRQTIAPEESDEEGVYAALVLGTRDYIEKNRFAGAVLGLSGGIDSALTLCIAVDAIGAERVEAVLMPSRYTAPMSVDDARAQAQAMGVRHRSISIEPVFAAFLSALQEEFKGLAPDTTEENIQARVRGVLLMAISNKTGKLVLTTGNKSEMAVGYATLYGDMAGGFAPIKDVPKTLVYRLAAWRNRTQPIIPRRVIERPPSAELRPDQKDTDSLPPYDVLDAILERYIEGEQPAAEIIAAGFERTTVERVLAMVERNEYKRRQAPPGVRITSRAFGRDRRFPITSGFGRSGNR